MSLIDNLLIAARLRARGVHLRRETCDLAAVARSVLDRLRPQLDEAHVELVFTCTAASCWGCWDPLALERMLTNLLTNAIKYGEGKPIALSIESRERFAAFVVADHGPGIPTAEQKHLFDPFEKGAAGQAAPLSYGLGLSIVRDLARAHGGEVGLDSRPGKGTAVRVTLPRERRRWAAASPLLAQRS